MPASDRASARLPDRPSTENLRKRAKGLARRQGLKLAAAQHQLARHFGFADWATMIRVVEARKRPKDSPLSDAARRGDVSAVRKLLAAGAAPDGADEETDTPLYLACGAKAPAGDRIAIAQLLIGAGAFTRRGCTGGATPLHAAAGRGPGDLIELLLRNGALLWQPDDEGRCAYDVALQGAPEDKERVLFMLKDGPRISDPLFIAAVAAIQSGDEAGLAALVDAHPHLLRERAIEPDFGARGYFSDPKLFWFVANNPTLVPQSPPNIVSVTRLMIERGIAQEDLDYTLGLVMTNGQMPAETQLAMVRLLTESGAGVDHQTILMSLGHQQSVPIAWLVDHGLDLGPAVAAGLGRIGELPALLAAAPDEATEALAMATINRKEEAVRLCLEAGADPNAFMPCHSHSTPLHQAALHGDIGIMRLLVARGARTDIEDKLWHGTALAWALHGNQADAAAWLRGLSRDS